MNVRDPNIEMVRTVANALGDLCDDVLFIGGAVVGLLITDPAAPDLRPTTDVDVLVEVATPLDYSRFERELSDRGFTHDPDPGAPICRKVFGDVFRWHRCGRPVYSSRRDDPGGVFTFEEDEGLLDLRKGKAAVGVPPSATLRALGVPRRVSRLHARDEPRGEKEEPAEGRPAKGQGPRRHPCGDPRWRARAEAV